MSSALTALTTRLAVATIAASALAPQAFAQSTAPATIARSLATGAHIQSFSFGAGSDVDRAQLFLVPLAFQQRLTSRIALDGYTAWARGTVEFDGTQAVLSGPVDSWLRARWAATPWAVLAWGVSLPTGVERHSTPESIVANILSNDLLGFREGNWGGGLSTTAGITAVQRIAGARLTAGASYRTASAFNPITDTVVSYAPGREVRMRVGLDREFGASRVEGGVTFQQFSADRMDRKNLFQSGVRVRGDVAWSRKGWSIFGANLWRAQGEATVPVINVLDGAFLRDTLVPVGWQNLVITGVSGQVGLPGGLRFTPTADIKVRSRENNAGRGWVASVGGGVPFKVRGFEAFPNLRASRGRLTPNVDSLVARPIWGLEASFILRRASTIR